MSTPLTAHYYPGPDKVHVFWDYENCSIPRGSELRTVIAVLKERIWGKIGPKQVPIQFKLYIRASKLNTQLSEEMDINGVEHINISSRKPESVDKRMLIDIALQLYELEKYKKSNAIALISGDKDFGHLLSRIHKEPPISHSILILLNKDQNINPNLSNNVDFVINNFTSETFKICRNKNCEYKYNNNCLFYHPKNNYYPMSLNNKNIHRNYNSKHKKKNKRHNKHLQYQNNDTKRRRINNNNNNNNNMNNICDSDSSIEFIEIIEMINIQIQQIGTDRIDQIKIKKNDKIDIIINELKKKYNNIEVKALKLQYKQIDLINDKCINEYGICDGDSLTWFVKEDLNEIECKSNALDSVNCVKNKDKINEDDLMENPYLNINGNDTENINENENVNGNDNDKDNESKLPSLDLIKSGQNINVNVNNLNVNNDKNMDVDNDDIIDLTK